MALYARLLGGGQHIDIPTFIAAGIEVVADRFDPAAFAETFGLDTAEASDAFQLQDIYTGPSATTTPADVQAVLELGYADVLYTTEAAVRARLGLV